MSSPHPNEGRRMPEPPGSDPSASAASSHERLPSLGQTPSAAQSDTPSSSVSFGDFSTGLSVDNGDRDADSAIFDLNQAQSSMSVASSLYDFVVEHGRTYHRYKQGNLQHMICVKLFGNRLSLAPIREPARVLDIGTGTGTWAIEFAIQHPASDVLGTDLSPIQPEYVPPNCRFEIDDVDDEWMFSTKFDYIHARHMVGSISDFPKFFGVVYDNLTPGGWVEMQDYYVKLQSVDGTLEGTTLQRWSNMVNQALAFVGRSGLNTVKYKRWLREAGFVDVREEAFALPGNPWAKGEEQKQLGALQMENILEGLHGISIRLFTKFLGMSPQAVEALLVDVRRDLMDRNIHFYYPIMTVYGRKPLSE
ncbi:putative methyltransferase domain-containing protein [Rosellinia necatrix]|uniref:Putative methyltransferase domain-containing protein n=1 Tax=Rosellinia necatrix TaxID=77044 RepID=A0A1S7UNN0_ROSNE|nr:putative methyltransferase domain-containing protein [Rosellinia necatrix]